MAIYESQINTWANQGATVSAAATYTSVKAALEHEKSPIKELIANKKVIVYLQGSYRNGTNIRGDSDVDIIVELKKTFGHDLSSLSKEEAIHHELSHSPATYTWKDFRLDVIKALESYYGKLLVDSSGNKSIKLLPTSGRIKADIVPVIHFRKYWSFSGSNDYLAEEGIKFYHLKSGHAIVNYPKHHYDNGVEKNDKNRTAGLFKPSVRVFKNAREYLIDKRLITGDIAPSYFLQSLIYNVPDSCFCNSNHDTYFNVLKHLYENSLDEFICQNEQTLLFGDTQEQWKKDDAEKFIANLVYLWDNWETI
ncbi:MAG: nucleotidyltransferase [Candidatus Moraniibacteriota bacterium]|nr:nucleotidyltransferase [Candidatus Moranbacteria bacterium]HRZ34147.1 nucleotidyltransferase [Candidatus Moranbacteria bacterium]